MKITGKGTLTVDGTRFAIENGATLNPGGVNRVAERHGGETYYREEEVPPSLECNVLHTADTDILALSNLVGATVMFEADTGQKFLLRGAFATEPVPIDSSSGKSALKLSARGCDQL
jgi:hypothetical protein